jgi:hypothetical protein
MRNGDSGTAVFTRATEGGGEEEVFLAYGPVHTRTLAPTNASVFAAGCTSTITAVYSIGFGLTMKDLVLPFTKVEDKVNSDIDRVKYISLALIVAAVLGVLYMTYTMCLYISEPILVLIAIVKSIQKKAVQDELPKLEGGSCEIYDVYESLEQLCKIVRFSNAAFLGDRTRSYKVMEDALALFEKMENQKAVGVANNNVRVHQLALLNTCTISALIPFSGFPCMRIQLGTMVLQEQMEKSSTTVRSDEVYFSGMKYFNEYVVQDQRRNDGLLVGLVLPLTSVRLLWCASDRAIRIVSSPRRRPAGSNTFCLSHYLSVIPGNLRVPKR